MIKILITSVGSLVGQNILDALESRRKLVRVIGMNSIAENQRNFRCDSVYLVPPTEQTIAFEAAFTHIFQNEQPDIVFAGRDIDVVFLAKYKEAHPEVGNRIPCGNARIAQVMYDKQETFLFAGQQNLPFADTFLFRSTDDEAGLQEFIGKHGLPLIVKPRHGFGSLNVFFLTDINQAKALVDNGEEVLIQEYLCPVENFDHYLAEYQKGMPLFFQLPDIHHYVTQAVIGSNRNLIDFISTKHTLVSGKAESSVVFTNKEILELVRSYIDALITAGWKGFLNIQYKPDRIGNWKVFEMNLRMVGATSSRLHFGFDEIGLLINDFFPEFYFPVISDVNHGTGSVLKYLTDYFLSDDKVRELKDNKYWHNIQKDRQLT